VFFLKKSYDDFISKIIKKKSYNLNILKFIRYKFFLPSNIFLTLRSQKKQKKNSLPSNVEIIGRSLLFSGSIKKDLPKNKCQIAKKKDIKKIVHIAKNELRNNRFFLDKKIDPKISEKIKIEWVKNYFKRKRGDLMILRYKKNYLAGFLLVIKNKKGIVVDLIAVSKKYRKKNIALEMLLFAEKFFSNSKKKINFFAGTIDKNYSAIKFYKKVGLKLINKSYIYHCHN
jgi:ribosomal protein S18 acetylase RimI-like enzyme